MGAIVAVNAVGNIVDPDTGKVIAGSYDKENNMFIDKEASMMNDPEANESLNPATNTTIGCIVTNAKLNQAQVNKLAQAAHDGYARAIYPTHCPSDGDTIFAVAYGNVTTQAQTWDQVTPDLNLISVLAVNAMERAIGQRWRQRRDAAWRSQCCWRCLPGYAARSGCFHKPCGH